MGWTILLGIIAFLSLAFTLLVLMAGANEPIPRKSTTRLFFISAGMFVVILVGFIWSFFW